MSTVSPSLDHSIAPAAIGRISCRIASGIDALSALEEKWPTGDLGTDAMQAETLSTAKWTGPMASFGWSLAAASALASEQTPHVATASDGAGTVCAIAPLARSGSAALGWLEMLGMRRLNEPADLIHTDREALAALIDGMLRLRRPLLLGRMPAESPTIDILRRACRGRALMMVRPQASCPFIPLDETWLSPEGHLSSRRRSDYRRALRRAEKQGEVRSEILTPRPEQLDQLLQTAFDIEARSWKGSAGTALACDPLRGGHLRQFAHWAAKAGTLRIAFLWFGPEPVAMQIATEEAGRWWLLKIGFDPAWSDCSPGTLLLCETLRHAVRQQLSSYEFLGTVEPWTHVWTEYAHECVSVRIYPLGFRGAIALAADAFQIAARRAKRALQSWRGAKNEPCSGIRENSGVN